MDKYKEKYPDWFDENGNYIAGSLEDRIERIKEELRGISNTRIYGQVASQNALELQLELSNLIGTPIDMPAQTEEKVRSMFFARAVPSVINTFGLSDEEALSVIDLHPAWDVDLDVTPPDRYKHGGKLWECLKPHKTQVNWQPSLNTSSLWKLVKVNADGGDPAGTIDDPIPYEPPMEIFEGLYYIQSNVKYKCTRSSGQPLTHNLSELVGIFVELIS